MPNGDLHGVEFFLSLGQDVVVDNISTSCWGVLTCSFDMCVRYKANSQQHDNHLNNNDNHIYIYVSIYHILY